MDYWPVDEPFAGYEEFSEHEEEQEQLPMISEPAPPTPCLEIPHENYVAQAGQQLTFNCYILKTPVSQIKDFCERNPNSYVVIPTSEKGMLRLSRINKYGYRVALIASLRDLLK